MIKKKKKREKMKPWWVDLRTELLVKLVLARLWDLRVLKFSDDNDDLLVVTEQGFCFFVVSKGFSSIATGSNEIDASDELIATLEPGLFERVRFYRNPVVLFYFNADTDHGRYLRLDTLPDTDVEEVRLPIANTITKAPVEKLICELQVVP
jgi:hypothetical protein